MGYAILRTKKLKNYGAVGAAGGHNARTRETPNANPKRTHLNRRLVGDEKQPLVAQVKNWVSKNEARLAANSPPAFEVLLTGSPEIMTGLVKQTRLAEWVAANKNWLTEQFGENLITLDLHLDERTPHLHAIVCPVVTKFDKRAKTEVTRVTCKEYLGGRDKLSAMQDSYALAMKPFGLQRGVKRSKAKHTEVKTWYTLQQEQALEAAKKFHLQWEQVPPPKHLESNDDYRTRIMETLKPTIDQLKYQRGIAIKGWSVAKADLEAARSGAVNYEAVKNDLGTMKNDLETMSLRAKLAEKSYKNALGKATEAEMTVENLEAELAKIYAKHPELKPSSGLKPSGPSR